MDLQWSDEGSKGRFGEYVEHLSRGLGHADRVAPFEAYCTGLLIAGERKSVEPMAARLSPDRVAAAHQSLLHFVGQSGWDDGALLGAVRDWVLPGLGAIEAWIVDDTGFPKKGRHSVGVARQYCGQLGKQDNCQVAVTLSVANAAASLPIAYRLYLPRAWAADGARRDKAGVPADEVFRTKPEIALSQIGAAVEEGVAPGVVLADAGYGANTEFRTGISALGLRYVAGILPNTTVWAPGTGPLPPAPGSGRGRRRKRLRRDADHQPQSVKALAMALPATAWRTVTWREGTAEALRSRFARLRVRPAHRDETRSAPWPEEWLLIEWPEDEAEPTRYWFSTMPENVSLKRLVTLTKLRWRIERDYLELKQELGLGHFEGRGWRGFHHHASLCIAAYAFLVTERNAFPPSGSARRRLIKAPPLPEGARPRGAADPAREARPQLHRHPAHPSHRCPGRQVISMPMLPTTFPSNTANLVIDELMTQ